MAARRRHAGKFRVVDLDGARLGHTSYVSPPSEPALVSASKLSSATCRANSRIVGAM
jgi:hypothetical protein